MKNAAGFLVLLLAGTLPSLLWAQGPRVGLFVGANQGGSGREVLRHAHYDAAGVARVFTDLGGMEPEQARLLYDPTVADLKAGLDGLAKAGRGDGSNQTEIVFYYSGHSDDEGLRLKDGLFPYGDLRRRLESIPVGLRLVILDSCASGSFTRAKGGKKQHGFLEPTADSPRGMAVLTSSAPHEVSRESDVLGGSFFTLSLITGLRGAAAADGQGRVSLFEAWRFASRETTAHTSALPGGAGLQRPTFEMNLSGTGEVFLTRKTGHLAELVLAPDLSGFLILRSATNGDLISQIQKTPGREVRQKLPAGDLRLSLIHDDGDYETSVTLRPGEVERIGKSRMILRNARRPSGESRAAAQAVLGSLGGGIGAGGLFFIGSLLGQAADPSAPRYVYLNPDTPFVMALSGAVLGELVFPPLIIHGLGSGTDKQGSFAVALLGSAVGVAIAAPLSYALAYGKSGSDLLPGLLPIFLPGLTATLAWQITARKKSHLQVYVLPLPRDLRLGLVGSF